MSEADFNQYFHRQWYWQHRASNETGWAWFPDWAEFFLDLGAAVATMRHDALDSPFTVVVAVPTGAVAGLLVLAGMNLESRHLSQEETPEQHLANLKSLPIGTTVTYQSPGTSKVIDAQFNGFYNDQFHLTVSAKLNKHSSIRKIPISLAKFINVAPRQLERVPVRQHVRPIAKRNGIAELFGEIGRSPSISPHLNSMLISKKSKAEHELKQVEIALVSEEGEFATGTLQDIVYLETLTDPKVHESFTTKFTSVDSQVSGQSVGTPLVVFDGCRSFVTRHDSWKGSTRIVVADRCESTFDDLTTLVNSELLYGPQRVQLDLPNGIPAGIELVGFVQ